MGNIIANIFLHSISAKKAFDTATCSKDATCKGTWTFFSSKLQRRELKEMSEGKFIILVLRMRVRSEHEPALQRNKAVIQNLTNIFDLGKDNTEKNRTEVLQTKIQ